MLRCVRVGFRAEGARRVRRVVAYKLVRSSEKTKRQRHQEKKGEQSFLQCLKLFQVPAPLLPHSSPPRRSLPIPLRHANEFQPIPRRVHS